MLNEDYSTNESANIPHWISHKNIDFNSSAEMLEWVSNDKVNFFLSDMVYDAVVYCLRENVNEIILATISVKDETLIDVVIRKHNFQKILSSYTQKLLVAERYEKLSEIKNEIQKYGLEITI